MITKTKNPMRSPVVYGAFPSRTWIVEMDDESVDETRDFAAIINKKWKDQLVDIAPAPKC